MTAKEVSALAGISVRTLHHYDEIGLICPARHPENSYRTYSREDLDALQQVLFFKACGFSLDKIKELLQSPGFDRAAAYELQRKALLHERQRIDGMLQTLESSLCAMKGGTTMPENEMFNGFDFTQNPYEEEARRLWGNEAVAKSSRYVASLGKEGQKAMGESFDALFHDLAKLVGSDPAGEQAQAAMAGMYRYFNSNFGYTYTPEAFGNLGRMYVDDTRFTKNIDGKYGKGLSAFLANAMAIYAASIS